MATKEYAKAYAKEVYKWRKEHGFCVRCGKEKAEEGKTMCLLCKMEQREKARERYRAKAATTRSLDAERQRLRRAEKNANGICLQCSKPIYNEHAYCYEHYITQKKADKKFKEKKYKYHPSGTCYICGRESEKGFKLCPEHHKEWAERTAATNKTRDRSAHPWNDANKLTFRKKAE
jgi:hypothetical protein